MNTSIKSTLSLVDFSDPVLREFLPILLQDHTTRKNIIWATDPPPELGVGFADEITLEQILTCTPVPRVQKQLAEQKERTRKKAEVFTPTWVCDKMITLGEENGALDTSDWRKYIDAVCMEVACGEAPFLTSRYDTVTGKMIPVTDRIGIIDRKLKLVNEHFSTGHSTWLNAAMGVCMSAYGCEWQGDNLLLARANVFMTVIENYRLLFGDKELLDNRIGTALVVCIADTVSWNLWQMDFLKGTVPGTDIPCKIMDWKENKKILYKEMERSNT